ncbi:MAG: hypothetical protein ACI9EK_001320 [Psychroserpens sp.]|jgi:hypothetical protein
MKITYKDIFKTLIEDATSTSIEIPLELFVEELYLQIKDQTTQMALGLKNSAVDEDTLKAFFDSAWKEVHSLKGIQQGRTKSIVKDGTKSWLTDERFNNIQWDYTNRYIDKLRKSNRSKIVVDEILESSKEIISKVGDPSEEDFYVKGLVVGEVQSGKTGNFNAVINRAIDCGYDLIIVFSGIMDDLRAQTQDRIEEDVVGWGVTDKVKEKVGDKGVGKEIRKFGTDGDVSVGQVNSVTTYNSDVTKSMAENLALNKVNILVCKKNVHIMRNLIRGLNRHLSEGETQLNRSLLIVDDEADNASLNNEGHKGQDYASRINEYLRVLLDLFNKKTYLGYTATPFANVIQDRNAKTDKETVIPGRNNEGEVEELSLSKESNIFPDDFISLLESPSNYIGAKNIFDTVSDRVKLPIVEAIDDYIVDFPSRVIINAQDNPEGVELYQNQSEWNDKVGKYGQYLGFTSWREYKKGTEASKSHHDFPRKIPESLKEAIQCFILAIAVRESRKKSIRTSPFYQPHNTMLVHISRFTAWQNTTAKKIEDYVAILEQSINNDKAKNPQSDSIFTELENTWVRYYADIIENVFNYLPKGYEDPYLTPIVFSSLINYLPSAIKDLSVEAINSVTKKSLKYEANKPRKVIAIGGNCLSRGFTLEGLTINYFVRTTNFSDSLLQMGRWFGYRPGYIDCCKLFTSQETWDKFDSTTKCIEELENEFTKMNERKQTPKQFEIKVKKHPGVFKITRAAMLKNTIDVKCSYQDSLSMTTKFDISASKINSVWNVFKTEVAPIFKDSKSNNGIIVKDVSIDFVISLLEKDNNFNAVDQKLILNYLAECKNNKKLTDWSVAVKTRGNAKSHIGKGVLLKNESNLPCDVGLSIRSFPKSDKNIKLFRDHNIFKATESSANILSNNRDLSVRLKVEQIDEAHKKFINEKIRSILEDEPILTKDEAEDKARKKTKPEYIYREQMSETEAVLIIYLFDSYYSFDQKKSEVKNSDIATLINKGGQDLNVPLVGYAIGIPPISDESGAIYVKGDYELDDSLEEAEEDYIDSPIPDDLD